MVILTRIVISGLLLTDLSPATTYSELSNATVMSRVITEHASDMRLPALLARARSFCKEVAPRKVGILRIATTVDDARRWLGASGWSDFEAWIRDYVQLREERPVRAEVLSLNDACVLRFSTPQEAGIVFLSDGNPLIRNIGNTWYRIVEVVIRKQPQILRSIPPDALRVHVFATAPSPSESVGYRILQDVQSATGVEYVNLRIRNDAWFIDDESPQPWFSFEQAPDPPTLNQYKAASEVVCFSAGKSPHCNMRSTQ